MNFRGFERACSSSNSPGNPAEREINRLGEPAFEKINSAIANPIVASRNCVQKMLHPSQKEVKPPAFDWAKFRGTRLSTLSPAHRRVAGKKQRNRGKTNKALVGGDPQQASKEPAGCVSQLAGCSSQKKDFEQASQEELDEFDREFFERCRLSREARAEEDRINAFLEADYACCVIEEVESAEFYSIPAEFSSAPDPEFKFGEVVLARKDYEHRESVRNTVSSENISLRDVQSISSQHRTTFEVGNGNKEKLEHFIERQARSKDFNSFPPIDFDLSLPVEDQDEDITMDSLCDVGVQIPSSTEQRKTNISFRTAKMLISQKKVQNGTILYCPQGSGKSYVARNFPSIIDSSNLPISFRNPDSLRKIADSGRIVLTNRLRDCDERTVYLVPECGRFIGNVVSRSLKTVESALAEYKFLVRKVGVKFRLKDNQSVADFLQYRMVVYHNR